MSANPGKQSLSELSASRIMAVIIGGLMSVIGGVALLVSVSMFASRESSSTTKGVVSVLITMCIFGAGLYLCRLAFREDAMDAQSGIARIVDRGLALVFGLGFAGLGIFLLGASAKVLIEGRNIPATGAVFGGAVFSLGVVMLRKLFNSR